MDVIMLGSMVFPVPVLLTMLPVLLATGLAEWFRRRTGADATRVLWTMVIAGLACARLVFVARHRDLYLDAPWSIFDIRDRGFEPAIGLLAAAVIGAELVRADAALRRPLLVSAFAGLAAWGGGMLAVQWSTPSPAPLPDVLVRRLDGTSVPLRGFAGKPVVINLWASWCPPCRREMPVLQAAQAANPGIAFVFVNQGESAATVGGFLSRHGLHLENVMTDAAGRVAAATGSAAYPTTLFYGASGRLALRYTGELSKATLQDKLGSVR